MIPFNTPNTARLGVEELFYMQMVCCIFCINWEKKFTTDVWTRKHLEVHQMFFRQRKYRQLTYLG